MPSWFQKVLAAELNYLADKKKVQLINALVYLLIVKKDLEPKRGRFNVGFYEHAHELKRVRNQSLLQTSSKCQFGFEESVGFSFIFFPTSNAKSTTSIA